MYIEGRCGGPAKELTDVGVVSNLLDVIHCAINPRVCDDFVYNGPMTGEGTALDGDSGCNSTLIFSAQRVEMRDTYFRTRETIKNMIYYVHECFFNLLKDSDTEGGYKGISFRVLSVYGRVYKCV